MPDFIASRLPLFAALFVVVVAAGVFGVHAALTGGSTSGGTGKKAGHGLGAASGYPRIASSPHMAQLPGQSGASPTASATPSIPFTGKEAGTRPVAGSSNAGHLVAFAAGAQLTAWNQTSVFCPGQSWQVSDGKVATDSQGDTTISTTGKTGSCVALISPDTYSSGVIEAYIDFPALPGKPKTIADWSSFWLDNYNADNWPVDGELDAVEATPDTGINTVSYHWGTPDSPQSISSDDASPSLPVEAPDLSPGWHVVDVVYTKGYFAVYYDGKKYTSFSSDNITGAPVNILITTSVTPDSSAIRQELGGPPVNSDPSPATMAIRYVKVWSYKG